MRTRIDWGGAPILLGIALFGANARAQETAPPTNVATAPPTADDTTPLPVPSELNRAQAGGLTAEVAGTRAAATSWSAKAARETLRGAAARVDEAWAAYLPRVSGIVKYTRLSNFTPPNIALGAPGESLVFSSGAPGSQGACTAASPCSVAPAGGLSFPIVLDNWLLQATLTVPISDYLLRIDQNYTAATHSQDAARWDEVAARAGAAANGKILFYTWLRQRVAVIVAVQSLNEQRIHLRDARNQFVVGNASKADVLRAETAVASAELALEQAKNLANLTEKQLRVAVHAAEAEALVPGEDLDAPVAPVQGNVKQLTVEALAARPEVKSADANADAARELAAAARAGRYPSLSAFADGIFADPNPRYFPSLPPHPWFPTWDLGAQLTWSPNDTLVAGGAIADAESRVGAIEANKNTVRDNIEVEVTQDWQAVHEADFSIVTSTREVASAEEAYRVARELFNNGRGTSTTLRDAETDLTRARYDLLNARAEARMARIRLDHAVGRDTK
jgi:outer membrane protein TolC